MPPCQERRSSLSPANIAIAAAGATAHHVPQHHRIHHRLEESMQVVDFAAPSSDDFSRDGSAASASAASAASEMDDSVTSSIFSQSFAGSLHHGYAARQQRRSSIAQGSSRSMSSSVSSMSASVAGGSMAGSSSRFFGSQSATDSGRSYQSCLSAASNPNSGSASASARRSSSSSTRGRRLRVKFHPKVQCQITTPRSSYSAQEKENTWYSSEAGKVMQRDILVTVQTMRSLHSRRVPADRVDLELTLIFGEDRTDRGLEHMRTARSIENRRRHKLAVSNAVLDEQALQWEEGLESGCREGEIRVAEASMVVSRVARDDAARKGRRDARFVERLVESEGRGELEASLSKGMDALALGKAAVASMHSSKSAHQDSKSGTGWTDFGDSSNAFAELKRTLSSEILESSDNPNKAEDAAKSLCSSSQAAAAKTSSGSSSSSSSKPAALKLERQGASRSITQSALRRMRLAQLASLSSEATSTSNEVDGKSSPARRGSPTSQGRPVMPRKNSLRAQGA